ncbi:Glucose 1-dehydrogenase [Methylocella tundrae]|uniref:Glucose 1-dehydrogenase n=1 Tax=Methylocella tundrae TaxID=227605 RepID=A0A8B6M451_METTU|nr:SDR family NAD(P)-dependent oxidoreductase [Methylocella tundrae]VTZ26246.1 Glucose 1-dehydrogenase [Methylocella tundrae]VTZ49080.1 Glucose 1-dehydrogenase [Methylocella tundrae]
MGATESGTAVVVGVGSEKGLGAALARRFAKEGLRVILAGRTAKRLEAVAATIMDSGGRALPCQSDATREEDVIALFDLAAAEGDLRLVAYNVGGNAMTPLLQTDAIVFEAMWRQNALGGFLVGREAVGKMLPQKQGTIVFTGATASLRARPPFTAFASAKAALRAVAQGFAREFGPQGIHVAHLVIDGVISGEYARSAFPDFVRAKGEDGLLDADAIADSFWALHRQPKSAWTHELDLRPFKEPF